MQIKICTVRGFQRLTAERLFAIVTVAGNAAISLILGSVFFNLPETADGINSRCVVLFFSILFNGLSSALEVILPSSLPLTKLHCRILTGTWVDSCSVRTATDRAKACSICPLPPV